MIIRFTDFEGVKHNPIIYTDFLAANATTGADTQAVLFEEGDYEVALNYTIKDTKVLGKEYDYRIAFKFSIRNGNTMFFPFDLGTGAELRDKAVTENGFMIDMAKSRYLNIDVERSVLVENSTGHTMDVRFNRPAKDGDKYSDEGIYVVSVTNQYTNEHTTKTFYVGSNPYYYALSKSGMDISGLDDLISQGYTISEDGSLMAPVVQESILEDNIVDNENANTIQEIQEDTVESKEEFLSDEKDLVLDEKIDAKPEAQEVVENEATINNTKLPIVPICLAITFILVVGFMLAKNKASKTISVTVDVEEDTGDK
ncbi:MAG: hypothetical protein MJ134_00875 [Lachnospiraceae bacterium]|nr:hypothetical protein [Lachnospiraceae bacterium]